MEPTKERRIMESMFRIADKDGVEVPFIFNSAQVALDAALTGRDVVPKARQEGVSSYFLGRYTVKCLSEQNIKSVVISHDRESTERMLKKVNFFLAHLDPPAVTGINNKNEITFPKTNSTFYIGTAGSRKFGRGDTINYLHCSEVAFWENAKDLIAGLFQAVPKTSGEIALESTGNGVGNMYHKLCMRASSGSSRYHCHFLPWHTFLEYTFDLSAEEQLHILRTLDVLLEEPELVDMGLTPGQIAWRRAALEELDYDLNLFKQEYPMTLDECFRASGNSIFQSVRYRKDSPRWLPSEMPNLTLLEGHPNANFTYTIGADVASGVGKDASAVEVLCLETDEQVGEYVNSKIEPDQFAYKLKWLGEMFNKAMVTVESNNHGLTTLDNLRKIYPISRIYYDLGASPDKLVGAGHRTTSRSKPLMLGRLRQRLSSGLIIYSTRLMGELSSFIEKENGKLEAETGCYDDTVIALAHSVVGLNKAAMLAQPDILIQEVSDDPFTLDGIIKELHTKGGEGFPISSHVIH